MIFCGMQLLIHSLKSTKTTVEVSDVWLHPVSFTWMQLLTHAIIRCWISQFPLNKHIEVETNGRHFADDIFKCIFLNENVWIPIKISLKFVPKVQINNIPALVQILAWRRTGDKPLSEPMMVSLLTHICVTLPQLVNKRGHRALQRVLWEIMHITLVKGQIA